MTYRSSKTYGHEIGLSCCFRQWRAQSHCRFLHGYALSVHVEFEATELDHQNWVVDFGSLKSFKGALEATFDHKTLVAKDDPQMMVFQELVDQGLAQVMVVAATGCEAFAKLIYDHTGWWLKNNGYAPRVRCHHVTVREHGANSASFYAPLSVEGIEQ
jgi:6-pyruvoyltetrahydropterin/6-carboxytetrahydropterin synthase